METISLKIVFKIHILSTSDKNVILLQTAGLQDTFPQQPRVKAHTDNVGKPSYELPEPLFFNCYICTKFIQKQQENPINTFSAAQVS